MAIPEAQMETWSHQGSVTQSKDTYKTIRTALESDRALYAGKDYHIRLQGSYCNDTNIYAESDVDVVMCLKDAWDQNLDSLNENQKAAYLAAYGDAEYGYAQFKKDVLTRLTTAFGADIDPSGKKAIRIKPSGNRRKADVLPCIQHRRYWSFRTPLDDKDFHEGITFYLPDGTKVHNFPVQHSDNCTQKHKDTNQWFKPTVRILKNMRGRAIDEDLLEDGDAPSYFIEGLVYNVDKAQFGRSYADTFVNAMNWIAGADRTKFVCANEMHYLVRDSSKVCWPKSDCEKFLDAMTTLWEQW